MCKININTELNGIELAFENKPDSAVLSSLKENGFRWHNKKKIWYAKVTEDRMTFANSLSDIQATVLVDDQKTLLDNVLVEYNKIWSKSPDMIDFIRKETNYVVELENGYYRIEKPRIETHFCFSYGYCGVSTEEDRKNAENVRHYAATKQEYFLERNLRSINSWLDNLNNKSVYAYYNYTTHDNEYLRIYTLVCLDTYDLDRYQNHAGFYKLSPDEIAAVVKGYETVKAQFTKRLNTYLKRYGLSKLHTWTYLSD